MHCDRCHKTITEQTVRRYGGHCVPCYRTLPAQRLPRICKETLSSMRSTVVGILLFPFRLPGNLFVLAKMTRSFLLRRAYTLAMHRGLVQSLPGYFPPLVEVGRHLHGSGGSVADRSSGGVCPARDHLFSLGYGR